MFQASGKSIGMHCHFTSFVLTPGRRRLVNLWKAMSHVSIIQQRCPNTGQTIGYPSKQISASHSCGMLRVNCQRTLTRHNSRLQVTGWVSPHPFRWRVCSPLSEHFFWGASSKKRAEAPNDEVLLEMVIFHTWPQGSPLRAAEITGTPVFHPAI